MANLPYNVATPLVCGPSSEVPAIDAAGHGAARGGGADGGRGRATRPTGVSVRVAYFARRPWSVGSRLRCSCPGRAWSPCSSASTAGRRRRSTPPWCPTRGWPRWSRPGSGSAARCCAARSPGWSRPEAFVRAGVRPEARAEELDVDGVGKAGRAVNADRGPGQADRLPAGDGGALRRLPRARRGDGDARPGRRAGAGGGRCGPHRGRGARNAGRRPSPPPRRTWSAGAGRGRPDGVGARDQADPARRRPRRRLGRRRRRAPLGRMPRTRWSLSASAPTCRSASWAAGPGSRAPVSGSPPCPSSLASTCSSCRRSAWTPGGSTGPGTTAPRGRGRTT